MAIREKFNPPVNLRTNNVSAKISGVAILRPLSDGGFIGFESVDDALGHPTGRPDVEAIARMRGK
ncbi:MAG: hypothetical protein GY844_26450 [Bradyrhizobium sp.]|jgi:hypothetical protein|uniref:hypothetical protein n=1 Tax=Sphingomonas sp. VL_57B TaxID=3144220 RepID=UPI0031F5118C|nr:hypothetical protein [Bradyrhizobium sp.]